MTDIDLDAILARHTNHDCGLPKSCDYVGRCMTCSMEWPCDAFRLAMEMHITEVDPTRQLELPR